MNTSEVAVATSDVFMTKNYGILANYSKDKVWLRVTYVRATDNTGKIDKVQVRL